MVLVCGHVELDRNLITTLGSQLAAEVYCEDCEAWVRIWRDAKIGESPGYPPLPDEKKITGGLFDEPPF